MAKKVVASKVYVKEYVKVIKMVKSKNGSYRFKETVLNNDSVDEFLEQA